MDRDGKFDVDTEVAGMTHEMPRRAVLKGVGVAGVAAAFAALGWKVEEALAQEASPGPVMAAEPNAILVLFGTPTDVAAFETHYQETHRALAIQIPGLVEVMEGAVVNALLPGPANYHRIAVLRFTDMAALNASTLSPEGQAAFGDLASFATGGVTALLVALESTTLGDSTDATPTA
jgi:uncharacterized protein (TIGR02118 family)